jgi:hypothetical protein
LLLWTAACLFHSCEGSKLPPPNTLTLPPHLHGAVYNLAAATIQNGSSDTEYGEDITRGEGGKPLCFVLVILHRQVLAILDERLKVLIKVIQDRDPMVQVALQPCMQCTRGI